MRELVGTPIYSKNLKTFIHLYKHPSHKKKFIAKSNYGVLGTISRYMLNCGRIPASFTRYPIGYRYSTTTGQNITVVGREKFHYILSIDDSSLPPMKKEIYYIDTRKGIKDNTGASCSDNDYFIGIGDYTTTGRIYGIWKSMMDRCYNKDNYMYHRYGEKDVIVCEEWKEFQVFAKWYTDNTLGLDIETYKFELDKDLTEPRSFIYSPSTCSLIPKRINTLLVSTNSLRGDLPVGVSYDKGSNKYLAKMKKNGKQIGLGRYNSSDEAFLVYKKNKEEYIKEVAIDYFDNGLISLRVYTSLMKWDIVPFPE